jgi:hypothetical protein
MLQGKPGEASTRHPTLVQNPRGVPSYANEARGCKICMLAAQKEKDLSTCPARRNLLRRGQNIFLEKLSEKATMGQRG